MYILKAILLSLISYYVIGVPIKCFAQKLLIHFEQSDSIQGLFERYIGDSAGKTIVEFVATAALL